MTDKEIIQDMNTAEIIKPLRIHFISYEKHQSMGISVKEILDIINRQQAEIEKFERVISYLEGVCESTPDKVRAEAIKEFKEKLRDLSSESDLYDRNERWVRAVTIDEINETYKEMVGEQG